MATVTKKSTLPYYCAAAVWVLYALLFPLHKLGHILVVGIGSAVVFFIMNALCPPITVEVEEKPVEKPKQTEYKAGWAKPKAKKNARPGAKHGKGK